MAKVLPVTDPDEAVSLFRAGLLMWRGTGCDPETLVEGRSERSIRLHAPGCSFGGLVILVEEDEEGDSPTANKVSKD